MEHKNGTIIWSQFGEDMTLSWLFAGRRDGFYIDIGGHHPYRFSNTASLHIWHNWRGINVDMDKRAIDLFDEARPNDINIWAGVASEAGTVEATFYEEGAINTLNKEFAASLSHNKIDRVETINLITLQDILNNHLPQNQQVDLLNIDVEGMDHEILKSNNWKEFRPEVICVESHDFDPNYPSGNSTFQLLRGKGYKLISHVYVTSIYKLV